MASHGPGGRWKVGIVVLILVVACVLVGIVTWQVTKTSLESQGQTTQPPTTQQSQQLGNLQLSSKVLNFALKKTGKIGLIGQIGMHENTYEDFYNCSNGKRDNICLKWENRTNLNIQMKKDGSTECYQIQWEAIGCKGQTFKDCFDLGEADWYGGYEDWYQPWPLHNTSRNLSAFVTDDSYQKRIGGVQERYFFSTKGVAIYVEEDVPLYISINATGDQKICLVSKYERYPYLNVADRFPTLNYYICMNQNVKTIHRYMSKRFFGRPKDIPDERLFKYPIWSTWAQYHKDINQSIVLEFAHDILRYNFSHSQIEIDDDWTPRYGDMDFNVHKFPNATEMIQTLNKLGFRVTIWLHPFFNIDSHSFTEAATAGYLVRQLDGLLPELVSWWDGNATGLLDVTNDEAVEWYLNKTSYLRETYNVSSFKYDAGETAWLPNSYSYHSSTVNPSTYSKKWAELAFKSDTDIRHQEVRVGFRSQHLPIFVRMLDKDTNWEYTNGLKTLIPTALTFGIVGYPFILPDMIGGNAYYNKPSKEIYIRWLEATTFLPSLQFSIVPWQFDEETVNITRTYLNLHEQYSQTIIDLAREYVASGAPIIRPLWWIAPEDTETYKIDSEFLLGNAILVAPILDQNSTARDIYLPSGRWIDKLRGNMTIGPVWLQNYSADLHELPYFVLDTVTFQSSKTL